MSNAARCQISFWNIAKYDSLVMGIFRINNLFSATIIPSLALPMSSSLANRHTRTKGQVVENAGIRFYGKRSGRPLHNRLWSAEKQNAASRVKSGLTEIRLPRAGAPSACQYLI